MTIQVMKEDEQLYKLFQDWKDHQLPFKIDPDTTLPMTHYGLGYIKKDDEYNKQMDQRFYYSLMMSLAQGMKLDLIKINNTLINKIEYPFDLVVIKDIEIKDLGDRKSFSIRCGFFKYTGLEEVKRPEE